MKRKQMGFTLVELMFVGWAAVVLTVMCGVGYIAIHFISKFW